MTADTLNLLLATGDWNDCLALCEALNEVRVRTKLDCVEDSQQLLNFFNRNNQSLPHLVFLELGLQFYGGLGCLKKIREDNRLCEVMVAIYSPHGNTEAIEEVFTSGANIFITKPADFLVLKNQLIQIINVYWQYHELGLRKEFFLLNV